MWIKKSHVTDLCRYITRPAVSEKRLSLTNSGNIHYQLKTPYGDGSTIDEAVVRSRLLNDFNLEIGAGLGALAGKVWRIGLMGPASAGLFVMALNVVADVRTGPASSDSKIKNIRRNKWISLPHAFKRQKSLMKKYPSNWGCEAHTANH